MHGIKLLFLALLVLVSPACASKKQAPSPYNPETQGIIIGKASCLTSGWFSTYTGNAVLQIDKLQKGGTATTVGIIGTNYSTLVLSPGVYGISKNWIVLDERLYKMTTPDYHSTDMDQDPMNWIKKDMPDLMKYAPEYFAVMKVEPGSVLYCGDILVDIVTLRNRPLFFVEHHTAEAKQALAKEYPAAVERMTPANWTGPAFILAKMIEQKKELPTDRPNEK